MAKNRVTYNLVCAPVVDAGDHLLGAVTVDDVLDHLLPDNWRELELTGTNDAAEDVTDQVTEEVGRG